MPDLGCPSEARHPPCTRLAIDAGEGELRNMQTWILKMRNVRLLTLNEEVDYETNT